MKWAGMDTLCKAKYLKRKGWGVGLSGEEMNGVLVNPIARFLKITLVLIG